MDTRTDDSFQPERRTDEPLTEQWQGLRDQGEPRRAQDAPVAGADATELHHTEQVGLTDQQTERLQQDGLRKDELPRDELRGDGELTLHAERLVPGVEQHEWARVRLTRRVVTEERTITVPVRREELVVEYLGDQPAPQGHPNTIKGSTDAVDSRVVEEYVLHQEVPRVEVDAVPYERVKVIVDQQRSLVDVSDTVRREELTVHDPTRDERQRVAGDQTVGRDDAWGADRRDGLTEGLRDADRTRDQI